MKLKGESLTSSTSVQLGGCKRGYYSINSIQKKCILLSPTDDNIHCTNSFFLHNLSINQFWSGVESLKFIASTQNQLPMTIINLKEQLIIQISISFPYYISYISGKMSSLLLQIIDKNLKKRASNKHKNIFFKIKESQNLKNYKLISRRHKTNSE